MIAVGLLVLGLACMLTLPALGEPPPRALTTVQVQLATDLAIVAAHEGALENARDLELIWQVVRFNADEPAAQRRWLRQHSGRALGVKPCVAGNCKWSSDLARATFRTLPPTVSAVDAGYWRTVTIPRYVALRDRAIELVAGAPFDPPCLLVQPRTWGGVGRTRNGADDRAHAARNGLFPIGCLGTANDGFAPRSAF